MGDFLLIIAYLELILWTAAFHTVFFHKGNSFAESASYALISTLMLFSFIFQISFMLGFPELSLFIEFIVTVSAIGAMVKLRFYFRRFLEVVRFIGSRQPLSFFALCLVFSYLAFLASSTLPEAGYREIFDKLNYFRQYGTFFLSPETPGSGALPPLNTIILSHLFLRAGSAAGTGLIGFLAYLSAGFSTYALSRRYAWPDTAFTVTFITLSLTRLVFLSTTPGMEIVPAAVSLFCILAVYRTLEQPHIRDMMILFLGIAFSVSTTFLCFAFPVILTVLVCVLFIRRHGKLTWSSLLVNHWKVSSAAVIPLVVFSQLWLFGFNFFEYGGWLGACQVWKMPPEGNVLLGAVANLIRYLFESLQLTWPLDMIFGWVFGFSFNDLLLKFYNFVFLPLFGKSGAAVSFVFTWAPSGQLSWFGPFGILFVIPAVVISIFRAHRRLKAIAIALAGYVYIVTLVVAWKPGNAEFFTILFTCGGFCVSFLLPPWRFTTLGKKILRVVSILLLVYVCVFNSNKPLLRLTDLFDHLSPVQKTQPQSLQWNNEKEQTEFYKLP